MQKEVGAARSEDSLLSLQSRPFLLSYSLLKLCHLRSQDSLSDFVGHLWEYVVFQVQQIQSPNSFRIQ